MSVRERGLEFKDEIFKYVDSEAFKEKYADIKDPKIAVVAHSMFLKILTSQDSYWTDGTFIAEPNEAQVVPGNEYSTLMMNCEFAPLMRSYPNK